MWPLTDVGGRARRGATSSGTKALGRGLLGPYRGKGGSERQRETEREMRPGQRSRLWVTRGTGGHGAGVLRLHLCPQHPREPAAEKQSGERREKRGAALEGGDRAERGKRGHGARARRVRLDLGHLPRGDPEQTRSYPRVTHRQPHLGSSSGISIQAVAVRKLTSWL